MKYTILSLTFFCSLIAHATPTFRIVGSMSTAGTRAAAGFSRVFFVPQSRGAVRVRDFNGDQGIGFFALVASREEEAFYVYVGTPDVKAATKILKGVGEFVTSNAEEGLEALESDAEFTSNNLEIVKVRDLNFTSEPWTTLWKHMGGNFGGNNAVALRIDVSELDKGMSQRVVAFTMDASEVLHQSGVEALAVSRSMNMPLRSQTIAPLNLATYGRRPRPPKVEDEIQSIVANLASVSTTSTRTVRTNARVAADDLLGLHPTPYTITLMIYSLFTSEFWLKERALVEQIMDLAIDFRAEGNSHEVDQALRNTLRDSKIPLAKRLFARHLTRLFEEGFVNTTDTIADLLMADVGKLHFGDLPGPMQSKYVETAFSFRRADIPLEAKASLIASLTDINPVSFGFIDNDPALTKSFWSTHPAAKRNWISLIRRFEPELPKDRETRAAQRLMKSQLIPSPQIGINCNKVLKSLGAKPLDAD